MMIAAATPFYFLFVPFFPLFFAVRFLRQRADAVVVVVVVRVVVLVAGVL